MKWEKERGKWLREKWKILRIRNTRLKLPGNGTSRTNAQIETQLQKKIKEKLRPK